MNDTSCWLCGRDPAEGLAYWQDYRLCHGDDTSHDGQTCYEFVATRTHQGEFAAAANVAVAAVRDEMVRIFKPVAEAMQRQLDRHRT